MTTVTLLHKNYKTVQLNCFSWKKKINEAKASLYLEIYANVFLSIKIYKIRITKQFQTLG